MIKKFFGVVAVALLASTILAHKAHAATITISSGCSLEHAITAINDAVNENGCTGSGAFGTADAINIPAGTVTLGGDLPVITQPVSINGATRATTIINAANYAAFATDYSSSKLTKDISLANLTIASSSTAINVTNAKSVTVSNVEVHDSVHAVLIRPATTASLTNCYIHDNVTDPASNDIEINGVLIELKGRVASDVPTATIANSQITHNTSASILGAAGLFMSGSSGPETGGGSITHQTFSINGSNISNNHGGFSAGLDISDQDGPTSTVLTNLTVNATTLADNETVPPTPQVVTPNFFENQPIFAGFYFVGNLSDQPNLINVTLANNRINDPAPDNRQAVAGIIGAANDAGASLKLVNVTMTGNTVTQPGADTSLTSAIIFVRFTLDSTPAVTVAHVGISSTNGLFAHNLFNGINQTCRSAAAASFFGLSSGDIDLTPTNLGHNLIDDSTCTGYPVTTGLYDTIDHEVKDNGGPVPTIALHDNSPAVNAGQVLGVSTDARGVDRNGYVSVGAYQGVILAATTVSAASTGQLAKTGIFIALATPVGLFVISVPLYLYWDFRRHKAPLLAVDPAVDYSFWHHMRMVSLPVARYRLSIGIEHKVPSKSDELSRF